MKSQKAARHCVSLEHMVDGPRTFVVSIETGDGGRTCGKTSLLLNAVRAFVNRILVSIDVCRLVFALLYIAP